MLHEWLLVIVMVLQLLLVGVGMPIVRGLLAVRRNDLTHIGEDIKSIKSTVERLESRLERHLEWHAGQS